MRATEDSICLFSVSISAFNEGSAAFITAPLVFAMFLFAISIDDAWNDVWDGFIKTEYSGR